MPKKCVEMKMKGGMSKKAAVKACYPKRTEAKRTAKEMLKGAAAGAAWAGASGVTGSRGKTTRKGKEYRAGVIGGALMGAGAGYAKARQTRKKNKK
tara:strand:- start:87 stop:374 length:288 start_codon:yes stop_codon:yes gene_type:complete